MNLRLKRTPGLYVVGFPASGKSTIGRHLAGDLGWSFFDSDDELERAERASVASLLETRGEAEFRRLEAQILRQHVGWIERGRPAVVAVGSGAFLDAATRDLLLGNGVTVWLDCPLEVVARRAALDGDLLRGPFEAGRAGYARADLHIVIESDDPAVTVKAILSHPMLK